MARNSLSSEELNVMVKLARNVAGVYGARLTGGGFGGCTVNLVPVENVAEFRAYVAAEYERIMKLRPEIYVCEASNGAEEIR